MKWFDNWFANKVQQSWTLARAQLASSKNEIIVGDDRHSIGSNRHRMSFTVYRANGGMMVEYNRYDDRKDQHYCELHIIHPDENLGDALSKIVTFESLKS